MGDTSCDIFSKRKQTTEESLTCDEFTFNRGHSALGSTPQWVLGASRYDAVPGTQAAQTVGICVISICCGNAVEFSYFHRSLCNEHSDTLDLWGSYWVLANRVSYEESTFKPKNLSCFLPHSPSVFFPLPSTSCEKSDSDKNMFIRNLLALSIFIAVYFPF